MYIDSSFVLRRVVSIGVVVLVPNRMQFSIVPYDLKDLFPCIRSVRTVSVLLSTLLGDSVIFIVQLSTLFHSIDL